MLACFSTSIFPHSECLSRQRRYKLRENSAHRVQTQGDTLFSWVLRHSYEVDFPACNVQNSPHLPPYLLMTHAPPPPSIQHLLSGSLGRPSCYTCSASACPVQPSAATAESDWDSLPVAEKESITGWFIYVLVYFFPEMGQWLRGRGGKAQKRNCSGSGLVKEMFP